MVMHWNVFDFVFVFVFFLTPSVVVHPQSFATVFVPYTLGCGAFKHPRLHHPLDSDASLPLLSFVCSFVLADAPLLVCVTTPL